MALADARFFSCSRPFQAVSARSSLHVDGDVTIHALELDGALRIVAAPGASLVIKALSVRNAGATRRELGAAELADGAALPEVARLRGYVYDEAEVAELSVSAGAHVVDGAPTSRPAGLSWTVRTGTAPVPIA